VLYWLRRTAAKDEAARDEAGEDGGSMTPRTLKLDRSVDPRASTRHYGGLGRRRARPRRARSDQRDLACDAAGALEAVPVRSDVARKLGCGRIEERMRSQRCAPYRDMHLYEIPPLNVAAFVEPTPKASQTNCIGFWR